MADVALSPIEYSIHSVSSFSAVYVPTNIIHDNPSDQSSRWSGANTYSNAAQAKDVPATVTLGSRDRQWICLKLEKAAVVKRITFGKYMKPHPCNLREFKVFGGQTPIASQMMLLYHGGLKNDSVPETFELRFTNSEGITFPCEYIRIEPLVAHSVNYNVSIWHVALLGMLDGLSVATVSRQYQKFRETKTLRLMLKHLRQRGMYDAFEAVRAHVCTPPLNVSLEHPLLSQLYTSFVLRGDFHTTEALLSRAAFTPIAALDSEETVPEIASGGPTLFTRYIQQAIPKVVWERLDTSLDTFDVNGDAPGPRGGHQLVFSPAISASGDEAAQAACIYLLGGWNGVEDLPDFWRFDIMPAGHGISDAPQRGRWALLSRDTGLDGGPTGRSCHKACIDDETGDIYVFGRFIDGQATEVQESGGEPLKSDFYRYHTRGLRAGQWEKLSSDVAAQGGPPLIYDHQMIIDSERRTMFTFGGKLVRPDSHEPLYSGLFAYSISDGRWNRLLADPASGGPLADRILSRIGHSMLFDSHRALLYIFAGQRNDTYLSDLWSYHVRCITEDYHAEGGPQGGFTQRATIDVELGEWHMLSGLMMDRQNRLKGVQSSLWIRRTENNTWMEIGPSDDGPGEEPKPRFAHQMVYDPQAKVHYLFGGNPAEAEPNLRLGDFWRLELLRLTPSEVLRRARFLVRRQRFIEMCQNESPMPALLYLQNSVASVTDHNEEVEAAAFRACMSHLLAAPASRAESTTGSPAASGLLLRQALLQPMDEDETDAVMASSQDFDSLEAARRPLDAVTREGRHRVFEELLAFFPIEHTEPKEDLVDVAR